MRLLLLLPLILPLTGEMTSTNPKCRIEVTPEQAGAGPCDFDVAARSFAGTPADQARCLLRHVGEGAAIGPSDLTPAIAALIDTATVPDLVQLARYVGRRRLSPEQALGGPLSPGLSARYFVIHDTSDPNCSVRGARDCPTPGVLPPDRDTAAWPPNRDFGGFAAEPARLKAHVIANRTGDSLTAHNLAEHVSHTRFDFCFDAPAKRNLFVGIELIQPRIGRPALPLPGARINDLVAPTPGFTSAQYRRLALLYLVASARHGRWLIPAYHAVLDPLYDPPTAHDDPQHFDLVVFTRALQALIAEVRRTR